MPSPIMPQPSGISQRFSKSVVRLKGGSVSPIGLSDTGHRVSKLIDPLILMSIWSIA